MKKEEKIEVFRTVMESHRDFRVVQLYEFAISNENELYPYVQKEQCMNTQVAAYRRVINHFGFPLHVRWEGEKIIVERKPTLTKVDPIKLARKVISKFSEPTQKVCKFVAFQKVEFMRVAYCKRTNDVRNKERTYDTVIRNCCLEKYVMWERNKNSVYLIRKVNENELDENRTDK